MKCLAARACRPPCAFSQHVIGQQRAELVAGERVPRAHPVLNVSGAAQPMRSQSGSVASTRSAPVSLARAMIAVEDRRVLRIRDVARHVRKIAVRLGVRAEDLDVAEAVALEHRHDGRRSDAMQRRVDDLQIARAGRRLRQHGLHETWRRLRPGSSTILPAATILSKSARLISCDVHHALDDALVVRRQRSARRSTNRPSRRCRSAGCGWP